MWTNEKIDALRKDCWMSRFKLTVGDAAERAWSAFNEVLSETADGERALIRAAVDEAKREEREVIVALADASTGPTGGWLISPKKFTAAILARGDKEPRDAER